MNWIPSNCCFFIVKIGFYFDFIENDVLLFVSITRCITLIWIKNIPDSLSTFPISSSSSSIASFLFFLFYSLPFFLPFFFLFLFPLILSFLTTLSILSTLSLSFLKLTSIHMIFPYSSLFSSISSSFSASFIHSFFLSLPFSLPHFFEFLSFIPSFTLRSLYPFLPTSNPTLFPHSFWLSS